MYGVPLAKVAWIGILLLEPKLANYEIVQNIRFK